MAFLKLFSCAEVPLAKKEEKPIKFDELCPELIYIISTYVDNPFVSLRSLNRYFNDIFSKRYSVKSFFKERFDIPELVTDDVDENDIGLKILLDYSRFINSERSFSLLLHQFNHNGRKMNSLLPNLMKYLKRIVGNDETSIYYDNIRKLTEHGQFDYLFKYETPLFYDFAIRDSIVQKHIQAIIDYISVNSQHIEEFQIRFLTMLRVHDFEENLINERIVKKWIKFVLVSNIHVVFLFQFPEIVSTFLEDDSFWIDASAPIERYPKLFVNLHTLIEQLLDGDSKVLAKLRNLIRFGPDCPELYETQIEFRIPEFSSSDINLMCHCASLARKKDLFTKLIKDHRCSFLNDFRKVRQNLYKTEIIGPIERNKLLFDCHELLINENDRENFYSSTNFVELLKKHCLIVSVKWNKENNKIGLEFKTPLESIHHGIPERVNVHISSDRWNEMLLCKFDNESAFEELLPLFLAYPIQFIIQDITGNNLKMIIKSASFLGALRNYHANNMRPILSVGFQELLDVVDEPVVESIKGLIHLNSFKSFLVFDFKTKEQFQGLEILTGESVPNLIRSEFHYFTYRTAYKYVIGSGQKLPENIGSDTLALLKIEFPCLSI